MKNIDEIIDKIIERKYLPYNLDVENIDFNNTNRCHDWRNHIQDDIKGIWNELTIRERKLLMITAEELADNEEWD